MSAPNLAPKPEDTAGPEVADLAESAGLILDPWQRLYLDVSLAENPTTGLWEAFESGLVVSRQNGKDAILEAIGLGGLFLLGEEIAHTAQLMSTAKDAFARLLGRIQATPHLRKLVPNRPPYVRQSADDFSIRTTEGPSIGFSSRSSRGGRGFGKDRVIYNEALFLDPEEIAAQVPTMSTRANPQLMYASSAGRAGSGQLRAVRDRGRAQGEGLTWFEWSLDTEGRSVEELVAAGVLDDEQVWAQTNPALGIRISLAYIRGERRAMSANPELFLRERLGVFDEPATAGRVISAAQWDVLAEPGLSSIGAAVFAVDVNEERTVASIAAAGLLEDGLPLIELVATGPAQPGEGDEDEVAGLGWVVEWAAERRGVRIAVAVNGPAGGLAARLEAAGADVVRLSDAELARGSQALLDMVTDGELRHLGDPVLGEAVAAGRKKESGDGAWRWSRKDSAADITALVAATEALHVLTGAGGEPVWPGFDQALHVADVEPAQYWPRYWAVRLGSFLSPSVWQCWAEAPDGRLVLERELYRTHVSPAELGAMVAAVTRGSDGEWLVPKPRVVLSDADVEAFRPFQRAVGKSCRAPQVSLEDGLAAVGKRLAGGQLLFGADALVEPDPLLAAAHRPTCTTEELPGYVWDADKEVPCDGHGVDCARWVVAYVDLRPRGGVRLL